MIATDEEISKLKINKTDFTKKKNKKKKIFLLLILLIIFSIPTLYFFDVIKPDQKVQTMTISKTYPSQFFTILNASGYVVAERKAAIASKITGKIISLSVEEGSRVKKGQIIAQLENNDIMATREKAVANLNVAIANLEQSKAEFYDAEIQYNRNKNLIKKEFISRSDYDNSFARYQKSIAQVNAGEASIDAAKAAIKEVDISLEYTFIKAPFDAVVLTKNADIGDIITPIGAASNAKSAVVTIADMDSLYVEADVSETNISKIKLGQPCEIQIDALQDLRFKGRVSMIIPTADKSKGSVMVKIKFIDKDKKIIPEMSAKIAFLQKEITDKEQTPIIVINPSSIVNKNGRSSVFIIKDNNAFERPIKTGRTFGDIVEITEGLKMDDKIIAKPSDKIKTGIRVKIEDKQ